MSRLADLDPTDMTPAQRELADVIASTRSGVVRGPFAIWLRLPGIAAAADAFGTTLREHGLIERRLFELMTLVIARHWSAQYEWFAHVKHAASAGLTPDVVEAIRTRTVPAFARDDEQLIYDVVNELLTTRDLSAASYDRTITMLGIEATIELMTSIGFYTSVAIMLKAFDAPVPGGALPLPLP